MVTNIFYSKNFLFAICISLFLTTIHTQVYTTIPSPIFGLINTKDSTMIIPLKNININVIIQENVARVDIEQEYYNDSGLNLETQYRFPISESAVFDSFTAEINNQILVGTIKKKKPQNKNMKKIKMPVIRWPILKSIRLQKIL